MSRKVLGLDIQTKTIHAVLVKSSLRESRIAACMSVPIAAAEEESDPLRAALETVAATLDMDGTDCAVSIPAVLFSCRNLSLPFANAKKIRLVLPFELEPHLPYPTDEVAIEFSILPGSEENRQQAEVLAAAVERAALERVIGALSAAGIDPERVTLSGYHAAQWLGGTLEPQRLCLCADIGDTFGALYAVLDGQIRMIRSFPLPAEAVARTRTIRNHLRMTQGVAAELGLPADEPAAAILTGCGLAGIDPGSLVSALPLSLQPADLENLLNVPFDGPKDEDWHPGRMGAALALAMAEIEGMESLNFHRGQFPGKKLIFRFKDNLVRTGVLAAAVVLLMFASVITQSYMSNRRLTALDGQMTAIFKESFPEVKKISDPLQQMKIKLQELKKASALAGDSTASFKSIDLLKSISENIPDELTVVFDRMVIGSDNILISGSAGAFNTVDDIKGRLERIAGFKKVTINSANTDRSGKEINFQIKVDL
jgi:Tfp pilus assembly protein PilN